jgi:hypothetical protein
MPKGPRTKRSAVAILQQWGLVVVFFLPIWLVYAYAVAPGVAPESRVTLDVAVPVGAFLVCAGLSLAYRAWQRARRARLLASP